jgi:hypothetical protein
MSAHIAWPWVALLLLGAAHGINPGMGWLFAVALGLQRRERRAVWRALLPLAGGHAAAVAVAALIAGVVGMTLTSGQLKWVVATCLLGVGVSKLIRTRHPRYGGMAVGGWHLAVWSFLMASVHGAGLMAVPFLIALAQPTPAVAAAPVAPVHAAHAAHALHGGVVAANRNEAHSTHMADLISESASVPMAGLGVALVHTLGYLLITGIVAVVVYERLGLRLLGRAWFNVDRIWAGALIVTAVLTPVMA